jgi:hypothetical protein
MYHVTMGMFEPKLNLGDRIRSTDSALNVVIVVVVFVFVLMKI